VADFGKISWKKGLSSGEPALHMDANKAFRTFLDMAQDRFPDISLLKSCDTIERESGNIKTAHNAYLRAIIKEPFAAFFIRWIKEVAYSQFTTLDSARSLLANDLIGSYDIEGNIWTIGMAHSFEHKEILSAIRCKREWTILKRENLVSTYIEFINWLSKETYGYIPNLSDPDLIKTKNRLLEFSKFIQFLDALSNEKTQLVAKMLYFGGDRTLDHVLKLVIEQINLDKMSIDWTPSESDLLDFTRKEYPEHVFNDIKSIIGNRKEGLLFLGRQDAPLNDATIFRHFNEAALKVGLGESFGPKRLIIDRIASD